MQCLFHVYNHSLGVSALLTVSGAGLFCAQVGRSRLAVVARAARAAGMDDDRIAN